MAQVQSAEGPEQGSTRGRENAEIVPFERRRPSEDSPLVLARVIEGEIIPRLMMAHQVARGGVELVGGTIGFDAVERFVALTLSEEIEVLVAHVDAYLDSGVEVESVFFDLLSPSAKRLGTMWEEDLCSFADVTVGLCRLQQIVYDLGARSPPTERPVPRRNALFALTPGDQHTFGLVLVVEFFRRAGWHAVSAPDATQSELIQLVRSQPFDLVGFSMSDEKWLEPLPAVIAALRAASCNPGLRVIVGGRVFSEKPSRVAAVGADATAEDARQAVQSAASLVDRPSRFA